MSIDVALAAQRALEAKKQRDAQLRRQRKAARANPDSVKWPAELGKVELRVIDRGGGCDKRPAIVAVEFTFGDDDTDDSAKAAAAAAAQILRCCASLRLQ